MREPGFSKERRLQPQITVGLLADETGVPLRAGAFDDNKAETATMIPMINDFMDAYSLDDVVVVADAGMISAATRPSTTATAPTKPDARYVGSAPRSPRPRKSSQERSPSNATALCACRAPPGASTATWRKGPGPWPGGRATSPACPTPTPRQSSAPTTVCTTSRSPLRMSKSDLRTRPHLPHPRELFRTAGRAGLAGCCRAAGRAGVPALHHPAGRADPAG